MKKLMIVGAICAGVVSMGFTMYPIDGYKTTGIARLFRLHKMQEDSIENRRIPFGAFKKIADIKLNLLDRQSESVEQLLTVDDDFDRLIKRVLPSVKYSATVMDMSNPDSLRYVAHRGDVGYQPVFSVFYWNRSLLPTKPEVRGCKVVKVA